jgi:aminomethyltransferase
MVPFAGWDMPVHYGSQIEEHHAVRRAAGMFDVSHMLAVDVGGPGARDFLRRALANRIDRLQAPGAALYSCLLNDAGGVVDDLIVSFLGAEVFRLVVNAGTAEGDLAWLDALRQRFEAAVSIRPRRDLALLAVQGPQAREHVWRALPETRAASEALAPFHCVEVHCAPAGTVTVSRTGYTGEDGFELAFPAGHAEEVWRRLAAAGVTPCGLGARDTLRLEAGLNLYGQDMDERTSPLEAGLAWTVDLKSGRDFVGREALQRAAPRWQLLGLLLRERGGVLRSHQSVTTERGAGEITSGTFSPTLGRSIALARLPLRVAVGARAAVSVRDKLLDVRVVKPPFVRYGKILVHPEEGDAP